MGTRTFSLIIHIILWVILPSLAKAEGFVVSGVVKDTQGTPIPFANVIIEQTSKGSSTDSLGQYTITCPSGPHTLIASAVGFTAKSQRLNLRSDTVCHFVLSESAVDIQSVKVTAKTTATHLKESTYTVNALNIQSSVNKLVTLNEIVDRSAGVKVRRQGGVGSDYDLSINGLSGNSIRYFIDGVPLNSKGNDVGLDNIPLNMVERVELYKGVVPAYLSADALGGAVNIVTKRQNKNYLDASLGGGSFHTLAGDISGQYIIPGTTIAIRPTFGINSSKNDYLMKDVEVWDEKQDKYILTDKRRFHDDFLSIYTQLEAGVSDVKWADQFFVSGSFSQVNKELQTGAMQNKVYGEAARHSQAWNLSMRYAKRWNHLNTRFNLSHTWDQSETIDTAYRKYSWDGSWLASSGNEISHKAKSIRMYKRPLSVISAGVDYDFSPHHNLALNYMMNRQENRRSDKIDTEFEPTNDVVTKHIVSLTYSQRFWNDRLLNSFFVKDYINATSIQQSDNSTVTGADLIDPNAVKNYWGAGWGSRLTLVEAFSLKASYEHSVRLPLSRELLGNGTTIYPNLTLLPEMSNNYNLGWFGTWPINSENTLNYEVNGFIRHVQNYIRASVSEREGMMQYLNEPAIDIKGFDFDLGYTWHNALQIALNGSWSDARDLKKYKTDGNPSATYNNRVPNRPWLFGNVEASYTFRNLSKLKDRLRLGCSHQWIHWYYLNWEAYGTLSSKAKIPTQNITNVDVTYSWESGRFSYNLSVSCDNIFNRLAYDNYMLQKPGRAIYVKFRIFIN